VNIAGNHFGENAGTRCREAEVTHELRMGPVRYARNNHAFDVSKDFIQRRGCFGGSSIQLRQDCSRLVIWSDPPLSDVLAVIRNPIGKLVQLSPEFRRRNVAKGFSIFHCGGTQLQATRWKSKGKAKAEMERAGILVGMRIGIDPVIHTDWPDR